MAIPDDPVQASEIGFPTVKRDDPSALTAWPLTVKAPSWIFPFTLKAPGAAETVAGWFAVSASFTIRVTLFPTIPSRAVKVQVLAATLVQPAIGCSAPAPIL